MSCFIIYDSNVALFTTFTIQRTHYDPCGHITFSMAYRTAADSHTLIIQVHCNGRHGLVFMIPTHNLYEESVASFLGVFGLEGVGLSAHDEQKKSGAGFPGFKATHLLY